MQSAPSLITPGTITTRSRRSLGVIMLVSASVFWRLSGVAVKTIMLGPIAFTLYRGSGRQGDTRAARKRHAHWWLRDYDCNGIGSNEPASGTCTVINRFRERGLKRIVKRLPAGQHFNAHLFDHPQGRHNDQSGDEAEFERFTAGFVGDQPLKKGWCFLHLARTRVERDHAADCIGWGRHQDNHSRNPYSPKPYRTSTAGLLTISSPGFL